MGKSANDYPLQKGKEYHVYRPRDLENDTYSHPNATGKKIKIIKRVIPSNIAIIHQELHVESHSEDRRTDKQADDQPINQLFAYVIRRSPKECYEALPEPFYFQHASYPLPWQSSFDMVGLRRKIRQISLNRRDSDGICLSVVCDTCRREGPSWRCDLKNPRAKKKKTEIEIGNRTRVKRKNKIKRG